MARIKICKEEECHNSVTTRGYCRLHYLRNWKRIRDAHKQVAARRLNRYIEQVCKENPEKCEEQRARMKEKRAEFQAKCAADPAKCEQMKQERRARFQQHHGGAMAPGAKPPGAGAPPSDSAQPPPE